MILYSYKSQKKLIKNHNLKLKHRPKLKHNPRLKHKLRHKL